jgi:Holliday junction resolvase RusA-like endonuclease
MAADNLAKFVLDALNGLLYADDSQVVNVHQAA